MVAGFRKYAHKTAASIAHSPFRVQPCEKCEEFRNTASASPKTVGAGCKHHADVHPQATAHGVKIMDCAQAWADIDARAQAWADADGRTETHTRPDWSPSTFDAAR